MTGLWSIVTPQEAINNLTNPSFERDTTDWVDFASGGGTGSRQRTADAALKGFYGYRITKTGGTAYGTYISAADESIYGNGDYVITSAFVRIDSGTRLEFQLNVSTAGGSFGVVSFTDGPYEGRIELVSGQLDGTCTICNILFRVSIGYTGTFDFDGVMIEGGSGVTSASTYFDGDTEECYWNGQYYASSSTRPLTVRTSGKIENFDDYGLYFTSMNDVGMAVVNHNIDPYAVQDGALYRNSRTPRRVFNLNGEIIGASLEDLHDKRRALIDLFKNDLTGGDDPFWLRYSGADETLQIQCRYDSGLEGSRRPRDGFSERLSLRFVAVNPFWQKDYNIGANISSMQLESSMKQLSARILGEWGAIGSVGPDSGQVYALAIHEGLLYAGGSFPTIDSDANMSYIAVYDGDSDTWSPLGTGADSDVRALAVAPNGDVYAGGLFTSMGGVANTSRIARWDKAAQTWNALGTGTNSGVKALAIAPDNVLYVGGQFTTANSVSNIRIARFDIESDTWLSAMSSGADDNEVLALAVAPNGDLYMGGSFTLASSVSGTSRIARWANGTTVFTALSTGMDNTVNTLAFGSDGSLYVGGDFTTAGGVTVDLITQWTGVTFLTMNEGYGGAASASVNDITVTADSTVIISGDFNEFGGIGAQKLVYWNGTTYYLADQELQPSNIIRAQTAGGKYDIAIGGSFVSQYQSVLNTITNNGTRKAYPIFKITPTKTGASSSFNLHSFEINQQLITFAPWLLGVGEEVVIDTRPGDVGVTSNLTGNNLGAVGRASSLSEFTLLPGNNNLLAFCRFVNATQEISMIWTELFWSVDGSS